MIDLRRDAELGSRHHRRPAGHAEEPARCRGQRRAPRARPSQMRAADAAGPFREHLRRQRHQSRSAMGTARCEMAQASGNPELLAAAHFVLGQAHWLTGEYRSPSRNSAPMRRTIWQACASAGRQRRHARGRGAGHSGRLPRPVGTVRGSTALWAGGHGHRRGDRAAVRSGHRRLPPRPHASHASRPRGGAAADRSRRGCCAALWLADVAAVASGITRACRGNGGEAAASAGGVGSGACRLCRRPAPVRAGLRAALPWRRLSRRRYGEPTSLATEALALAEACHYRALQADAHRLLAEIAIRRGDRNTPPRSSSRRAPLPRSCALVPALPMPSAWRPPWVSRPRPAAAPCPWPGSP